SHRGPPCSPLCPYTTLFRSRMPVPHAVPDVPLGADGGRARPVRRHRAGDAAAGRGPVGRLPLRREARRRLTPPAPRRTTHESPVPRRAAPPPRPHRAVPRLLP